MQDCRAIRVSLGCYYDGELSEPERRLVRDHLKQCSQCRAELQQICEIAPAFQEGMQTPPTPSDLTRKIMEKAHRRTVGALSWWSCLLFWKNWSLPMRFAAAGVIAAACYIGIVVGSSSLPFDRSATSEMKWISMSTQGPIVKAYMGKDR
jgi:predicted anti-sigma-YlaC factor YlaD